ncbi:MAG: hypothetical protein V4580_14045 [Bacteroidota bacterium]
MIRFLNKILFVCLVTTVLSRCNIGSSEQTNTGFNQKDTIKIAGNRDQTSSVDSTDIITTVVDLADTSEDNIQSISDIYKRSKKKASLFIIDNTRDTVIKCKEGTVISIPANAFETQNNNALTGENIRISVNEYYSVADMLVANLKTSSDGNMIETGGMFLITATSKDTKDSLRLKKGQDITIAIPTSPSKDTDAMQLFNGIHDSDGVDWQAQNGPAGFALRWRAGKTSPDNSLNNSFIFPDLLPKKTPTLVTRPYDNFTTEISMPIRELIQNNSDIIRSATGYIDTAGILHGYLTGNKKNKFVFNTQYTSSVVENINLNVAVSFKVKLKKKADVNISYFDKLFKLGKGNPDSLITVIVTFIPNIKKINYEQIKNVYNNPISVSSYKNKLIKIRKRQLAYDKHIKLLEASPLSNISTAQEYLLMSTQKLGWINCDRFYNNTNKVDYLVRLEEKMSLLIVFNNIKSIIGCDGKGIFHNVPLGEKITIVALKAHEGKIMLAMHETVITEKPFENLEFKQISLKEYKLKLQKLNSI